jgi:hypothetical protein
MTIINKTNRTMVVTLPNLQSKSLKHDTGVRIETATTGTK